jgi:protein-S-isoprenylcysteine O-methyltransferase Ste14
VTNIILINLSIGLDLRLFYSLKYGQTLENRICLTWDSSSIIINLALLIILGLSLIFIISPEWLIFSQRSFPRIIPWIGVLSLGLHLLLLWASHHELGPMWSGFISIKKNHKLVTSGIYRYIKHPMYLAVVFWVIGLILCTENLLFLSGLIMLPGLGLRIRGEEKILKDHFQQNYPYNPGETP